MRFRDYLGDAADDVASLLARTGAPVAAITGLLDSPLYANASAHPADGTYPLVLVAQGNGQGVADQAVLCEYLASHGFVVATTASPTLRMPLEREDQVGAVAEAQASDLAAARDAVAAALRLEPDRVSVVGHSFGARAALLLAMRDTTVRAIVSLDGGIGTATAVDAFRRAPSFRATAPVPPILHVYETLDAFMTPEFSLLRSLHTDALVLLPVDGMHHIHFTTYGFAAATLPEIATATHATPTTAASVVGVAEQTARFLLRHGP